MNLPPSPKTPKILQLLQWIFDPISYMTNAAQKYGDIFAVPFIQDDPQRPAILVSDPEGLKHLLSPGSSDFWAPGDMNKLATSILGDYSLFMLSGQPHQRQRKLLMPSFHGDHIKSYGNTICEISNRIMAALPKDRVIKMYSVMHDIALQVIMKVVLGSETGKRCNEINLLMTQLVDFTHSSWKSSVLVFMHKYGKGWQLWGQMREMQQRLDELLYAEICERRQQDYVNREDILSLLLSVRDEDGEALSDTEVRDQLLTMLFAGNDPTASALAWAFYWIHNDPAIYAKLSAELHELGANPDPASIYKLPYLTAVCNETIRMAPSVMLTFFRYTTRPLEFMGHHLEADTPIGGAIYLTHRRPDLYPNPETFRPERFLERNFSPYEFLPFGAGIRRCIGAVLAQYEMKLILATVLSRYSFQLCEKRPVKFKRRATNISPATGIRMKVAEVKTGNRFVPQAATV